MTAFTFFPFQTAGVSAHVCKPCQTVLCVTPLTPQLPGAQLNARVRGRATPQPPFSQSLRARRWRCGQATCLWPTALVSLQQVRILAEMYLWAFPALAHAV